MEGDSGAAAQQILAELVECSWRLQQPSQADYVGGELNQLSTSFVSQTQSRAAAESGCCLLNIIVESSTSRSGRSVVVESVVDGIKIS